LLPRRHHTIKLQLPLSSFTTIKHYRTYFQSGHERFNNKIAKLSAHRNMKYNDN